MRDKFGLFISERSGYFHEGYCSMGLVVRRHSCYSNTNSISGQRTAVTEGRGRGKASQSERGKTE